ncbi:hypothetical protein GCM10011416_04960 [Polaribacter pacificus]|uniref:Transport and Golgi organisation 2 n=1 Tax=Polaribacter pacificus TaxID=1775173 RepID=A0A917HW09_9FLAO|nr:NRDE family protein [Polaribacter pacificus]GGG91345.1 hypothetical protein GCM10011416_04960 [Polaribacter pacificus]
MCTVTYLPLGNEDFILTSNRDESPLRKTLQPKKYLENGVALTYPKDQLAGGTWIGLSEQKRLICLLNGGFTSYKRAATYRMSRGVIVKELLSTSNFTSSIKSYDLEGVEPFTIVLIDWQKTLQVFELVWDGSQKHFKKLAQEPAIWSSSTLYNEEEKLLRKTWFANWLSAHKEYTQAQILDFHQSTQIGSPEVSIKMKRNFVETVSTTSVLKKGPKAAMKYLDYLP